MTLCKVSLQGTDGCRNTIDNTEHSNSPYYELSIYRYMAGL